MAPTPPQGKIPKQWPGGSSQNPVLWGDGTDGHNSPKEPWILGQVPCDHRGGHPAGNKNSSSTSGGKPHRRSWPRWRVPVSLKARFDKFRSTIRSPRNTENPGPRPEEGNPAESPEENIYDALKNEPLYIQPICSNSSMMLDSGSTGSTESLCAPTRPLPKLPTQHPMNPDIFLPIIPPSKCHKGFVEWGEE
uniref:Protein M2 n=1 Tax=Wood mouse herpesvirus TaxID=432370 RepID=D0PP94_9GAMA|nr:protein M2 [Wood mouse herpesvirus]